MTNYEKIKDMSVEEMADFLDAISACNRCPKMGNNCFPVPQTEEWLLKEAENETGKS